MNNYVLSFYGSTNFSCLVQVPQSGSMYVNVTGFLKVASANATPENWESMQLPSFLWPVQEVSKSIVLQYQEGEEMIEHDALAIYTADGKVVIECDDPTTIGNYFGSSGFVIDFSLS